MDRIGAEVNQSSRFGAAVVGVRAAMLAAAATIAGCGPAPADRIGTAASGASAFEAALREPDAAGDARPRMIILGDSLTAGLGLVSEEAYPARLQARVDAAGWPIRVAAMGVSGDTTAGGRRRLDWSLYGDVRVLVVALGGNDALRGLPVAQMRENLAAIVDHAIDRDIRVVLAGMEAPPNFGAAYTSNFRNAYRTLAETRDVTFVPFLLEGVAGVPALNQADGIHPNATGAVKIADHLWPALEPLLAEIAAEQDVAP